MALNHFFQFWYQHFTSAINHYQIATYLGINHDLQLFQNSTIEMHRFFDMPSLNVIWQLVCGRRFDYNDQNLIEMIDHIEAFTMEKAIGPIVGTSGLKFIPPFNSIYKSVKNHMEIFKTFLSTVVAEGKKEEKETEDDSLSYMSAYFSQQSNEGKKFFSDKQLIISMQVFFKVLLTSLELFCDRLCDVIYVIYV